MVGLGSGAITPYRIHHLLTLIRMSRVFSLEVSRHTKRVGPLRRAGRFHVAVHRTVRMRQLIDSTRLASFKIKYGRQRRSNPS